MAESQRITPHIVVSNGVEALDYYKEFMGAKILEKKETEDGKIIYSSFQLPNGAQIMMSDVCILIFEYIFFLHCSNMY